MQLGILGGWKPENVMGWLFENPDGPDAEEQEAPAAHMVRL